MVAVKTVLADRGERYGDFYSQSAITEALKVVIRGGSDMRSDDALDFDMRSALDMIAVKVSRILSGNPHDVDSWVDIAGYASLVARRLEADAKAAAHTPAPVVAPKRRGRPPKK